MPQNCPDICRFALLYSLRHVLTPVKSMNGFLPLISTNWTSLLYFIFSSLPYLDNFLKRAFAKEMKQ